MSARPGPETEPIRYRALRLCSNGGGFEAIPERPVALDLGAVRAHLEEHGEPVVDARVMLIAGSDPEITVSRSGRILVKSRDLPAADRALARFFARARIRALVGADEAARTG